MNGLAEQYVLSLRLYFRNKMGMFYGYLFPAIFLLAFWVLYRSEPVPVWRHLQLEAVGAARSQKGAAGGAGEILASSIDSTTTYRLR